MNREAMVQRLLRAETEAATARRKASQARTDGQPDLVSVYLDQARAFDLLAQSLLDELVGGTK
jgi:hypothetical protein